MLTKTNAARFRISKTFAPAPVGDNLTRAELVAGLRQVYQQAQIELIESPEREARLYALAMACVLADVAQHFGLADGELIEIVGERVAAEMRGG